MLYLKCHFPVIFILSYISFLHCFVKGQLTEVAKLSPWKASNPQINAKTCLSLCVVLWSLDWDGIPETKLWFCLCHYFYSIFVSFLGHCLPCILNLHKQLFCYLLEGRGKAPWYFQGRGYIASSINEILQHTRAEYCQVLLLQVLWPMVTWCCLKLGGQSTWVDGPICKLHNKLCSVISFWQTE